jgi:hypothetical protein
MNSRPSPCTALGMCVYICVYVCQIKTDRGNRKALQPYTHTHSPLPPNRERSDRRCSRTAQAKTCSRVCMCVCAFEMKMRSFMCVCMCVCRVYIPRHHPRDDINGLKHERNRNRNEQGDGFPLFVCVYVCMYVLVEY